MLFTGGYRSLGLGGRTGLRQGGYGAQGAYGTSDYKTLTPYCPFIINDFDFCCVLVPCG